MARLPLVSPLERALFLKAQRYLEHLSSEVLAALASYSEERFYPAGSIVREAGMQRAPIFFLATGAVEVEAPDGIEAPGLRVEAPGAIGLADFFAGTKSWTRVRALEDTLLLELATRDFAQILEDHFSLFLQVARTSCEQTITLYKELGADRPSLAGFEESDHGQTPVELDLVHRLAQAKHIPFLRGTNLTILSELLRSCGLRRLAKGEVVWSEGDQVDEIVLVMDGCLRSQGSYGSHLASSGVTLGAWELFSMAKRIESWLANEPSRIIPVPRDLFTDLLEDHFEFAEAYLRRTSQNIVDAWGALARRRARAWGETGE